MTTQFKLQQKDKYYNAKKKHCKTKMTSGVSTMYKQKALKGVRPKLYVWNGKPKEIFAETDLRQNSMSKILYYFTSQINTFS